MEESRRPRRKDEEDEQETDAVDDRGHACGAPVDVDPERPGDRVEDVARVEGDVRDEERADDSPRQGAEPAHDDADEIASSEPATPA